MRQIGDSESDDQEERSSGHRGNPGPLLLRYPVFGPLSLILGVGVFVLIQLTRFTSERSGRILMQLTEPFVFFSVLCGACAILAYWARGRAVDLVCGVLGLLISAFLLLLWWLASGFPAAE